MFKFEVIYKTKETLKMSGVRQSYSTFAENEYQAVNDAKLMRDAVLIIEVNNLYEL